MLATVLALAAASPTVIDAERAFAQMAQDKGQWTAFRAYAATDAVMFTPQPVNAQAFLKPLKDPPKAIRWQPTHAWISCDGTLAVDTGNWQGANSKTVGFFTTVWQRQADGGWKWVYDGGDELTTARPPVAEPVTETAACEYDHGIPPGPLVEDFREHKEDSFVSKDMTLRAWWFALPDGSRDFAVWLADKQIVHQDKIAAPAK